MEKMVMAVVSRDQADRVLDKLISAGYGATFTESRGGMLRQAQKMIFVGVKAEDLDDVVDLIRRTCRSRVEVSEEQLSESGTPSGSPATSTTEVGYAVVFVWDLEQFAAF
ncbi:MAG: cyclic-di-AMP receptor [Anaerolineae bacterium]